MTQLRSPNEVMQAAKDHMLEGKDPESYKDYMLVMNFIAANVDQSVAHSACQVMAMIYDMPLSQDTVAEIVDFQLSRK